MEYENKGGDIVIGDVPININPSKYNFVTTTLAKTQTISSQSCLTPTPTPWSLPSVTARI